jgi:hypothetical protein
VPVSAANNVNNRLDYNLYFAPAGATAAQWSWNNVTRTGFTAWKSASAQDGQSLFADPKFLNPASAPPDLHLRLDSPAIDAGDPAFVAASGETDADGGARITGSRVEIGADELDPFSAWRAGRFGASAGDEAIAGATADPDRDGALNVAEYATGTDPNASSAPPLRRTRPAD